MEDPKEYYVKGFNHGYELQKHEPDLLRQLLNASNPESDYFQGLKDGQKEMEKEAMLDKSPSSQPDKQKDQDIIPPLDMDNLDDSNIDLTLPDKDRGKDVDMDL